MVVWSFKYSHGIAGWLGSYTPQLENYIVRGYKGVSVHITRATYSVKPRLLANICHQLIAHRLSTQTFMRKIYRKCCEHLYMFQQ